MKPKIALQLWSIQDDMRHNFFETLKKVKQMGYDGVEFAGYADEIEAVKLKRFLTEIGLEIAGSHIGFDDLTDNLEAVIAFEKTIGNQKIICPYASFDSLEKWQNFFQEIAIIQKKLEKENLTLVYHNHSHEFTEIANNDLLNEMVKTVPEIKLEVDTYWVYHSGKEVIQWLEGHRSAIELLHIKDMRIKEDLERESTEISSGILPIITYVEWAKSSDIQWLVVEQEAFQELSPIESARKNISALRTIVEEVHS